jgi:uncharacterized protein (DUF2141 family)
VIELKQLILAVAAVSLIWAGTAMADAMGNVSGEVTKMDGEMVTIKAGDGSSKTFHVDPKGTKKETTDNHANWIKEVKGDHTGMK